MADELDKIKQILGSDQSNIKQEYNVAAAGLNLDNTVSQVAKGQLTYALNASVENFDSSAINYQNEPGNESCVVFPSGFILIGKHFIVEQTKHIFFIVNPETNESQIGYMDNNDCVYRILVNAPCLAFNMQYPIRKAVHKITNCTTEIYWTDGLNPRRYLDINNIPYILQPNSTLCDPVESNQVDCNQLKLQPNFNIPELAITDIRNGGNLTAGTYQFAIQYCDASGNEYTSYYSVTNPTPIADISITTPNFNYEVGKSIVVNISNLDSTGQFQYFNLAVIKTVNNIPSVELVGTYFIDQVNKDIIYTGQNDTQTRLTIFDIFQKYPYYEIAQDLTAVEDILVWDNITSIDRINYQSIASQIKLNWETYRLPANENYADELNATNLRGYLRDEVYAFEIVFLLKNGKQTDGFHIPGRERGPNEAYPDVPNTNPDFIGDGTSAPYWKIYNTASVLGPGDSPDIGNAKAHQYGEFAYWESEDVYPCNIDIWGDLANKPIRHHKFPDVLVSPIVETKLFAGPTSMVMGNDDVFPIGVRVDVQQINQLIASSNLTNSQKSEIAGFKIIRGDRGTNKSIIAKGILRNVGQYEKEEQTFYYPNYPYNDLNDDPFLTVSNIAYTQQCKPWLISAREKGQFQYIDCNTFLPVVVDMDPGTVHVYGTCPDDYTHYEVCSIGKPITLSGRAFIGPADYDVVFVPWFYIYTSLYVVHVWPFSQDNTAYVIKDVWIPGYAEACDNPDGVGTSCYTGQGKYFLVDVGAKVYYKDMPSKEVDGQVTQPYDTLPLGVEISDPGAGCANIRGRRSTLPCGKEIPLPGPKTGYRQVFNSPETSFGQPFLGNVLKLENVMFGKGKAHFVKVKNNANYKLLSKEAQEDALRSSAKIADYTTAFNATAMFTTYQAYLTIYINGITRKNYAYSFNSIADYNYNADIENDLGIKQRQIDLTQYLIPGVQNVGDDNNINNWNRESSVYIKTIEDRDGIPVSALPFPSNTPSLISPSGTSIITDYSRLTIGGTNACSVPGKEQDISVVSYYASMKNDFVNQWGQIYSYDTVDTGFQRPTTTSDQIVTLFGGDTFISRFAFKTKLPFFIDNRVNAPDDSDVFYDEIGNVSYPRYWHSSRSILDNFIEIGLTSLLTNIISYKAHNFDCPNDPSKFPPPSEQFAATGVAGSLRTYYDGYFYLFAYGIPNFYCESSYNTDLRQAFNNKEGDFWPHVSTSIPDDWVQEDYVSIANDNTYTYNVTFSKQNKENTFTHLPPDWTTQLCYTRFPFRAIYSDTQNQNADVRVNNWLIYRPVSLFDFPQNYGKLVSLDGIQNKTVLARFENKSLLYNTMLTINTSNPQAAYIGNPTLFASSPPIDFAETDLGYVGSQNKFLLKIPQGQITVDAKRGQVFLISGNQAEDLSAFGSGMNRFFTDHLAFEILRYFPDKEVIVNNERIVIPGVDVDNNFTGVGLHGVYDSKYDRVIITKLDYIPIDPDVKYDSVTREFYVEEIINNVLFKTQVFLTDPEYFCNKSWTLSYHLGLKSWISFHSYIPNWYIAENNFFYSGINGCCTDIEGEFQALVGNQVRLSPTTTTTSSSSSTSTTTTTITTLSCNLEGVIIETLCELEGDAIITVPPSTTTTVCARPFYLSQNIYYSGYQIDLNPIVDSTLSVEDACAALALTRNSSTNILRINFSVGVLEINLEISGAGEIVPIEIGQYVYLNYTSTDCTHVPDGWYFTGQSWNDPSGNTFNSVFNVVNGYVVEIVSCECGTVDTTTTLVPSIEECCGILFNTSDTVYYLEPNSVLEVTSTETIMTLNIPNFSSTYGIAMTANYLWSVTTEFLMWDITLSPFSATFNTAIPFPVGFTTSSGIVALNDTTLVAIDDSSSPQDVVELVLDCNVTPPAFTSTVQFSLQADRTAIGNMLYTTGGKLLVINTDTISGDNYITQYDYATGVIELDLNIGAITPTSIYECNCSIFVVEADGTRYTIGGISPYELVEVNTVDVSPMSATQIATCVPSSITDNANITTTTSTSSTTTTTTTTP